MNAARMDKEWIEKFGGHGCLHFKFINFVFCFIYMMPYPSQTSEENAIYLPPISSKSEGITGLISEPKPLKYRI